MSDNTLQSCAISALEEVKGVDITAIDVSHLTSITDVMIICSGTSQRHVMSLANNVVEEIKQHGFKVLGVEGIEQGEWVLVDLGDVVVHVMQPNAREFYSLEKLWRLTSETRERTQ